MSNNQHFLPSTADGATTFVTASQDGMCGIFTVIGNDLRTINPTESSLPYLPDNALPYFAPSNNSGFAETENDTSGLTASFENATVQIEPIVFPELPEISEQVISEAISNFEASCAFMNSSIDDLNPDNLTADMVEFLNGNKPMGFINPIDKSFVQQGDEQISLEDAILASDPQLLAEYEASYQVFDRMAYQEEMQSSYNPFANPNPEVEFNLEAMARELSKELDAQYADQGNNLAPSPSLVNRFKEKRMQSNLLDISNFFDYDYISCRESTYPTKTEINDFFADNLGREAPFGLLLLDSSFDYETFDVWNRKLNPHTLDAINFRVRSVLGNYLHLPLYNCDSNSQEKPSVVWVEFDYPTVRKLRAYFINFLKHFDIKLGMSKKEITAKLKNIINDLNGTCSFVDAYPDFYLLDSESVRQGYAPTKFQPIEQCIYRHLQLFLSEGQINNTPPSIANCVILGFDYYPERKSAMSVSLDLVKILEGIDSSIPF